MPVCIVVGVAVAGHLLKPEHQAAIELALASALVFALAMIVTAPEKFEPLLHVSDANGCSGSLILLV